MWIEKENTENTDSKLHRLHRLQIETRRKYARKINSYMVREATKKRFYLVDSLLRGRGKGVVH